MTDLFGFTEEDAESNFPTLQDKGEYVMTIQSIEQKTAKSGKEMFIFACLFNKSPKPSDIAKKYDLVFMATPQGNKARYQFSSGLFSKEELMSGKLQREDFVGITFSFIAKQNGEFFNYTNVKKHSDVPVIEGIGNDEATKLMADATAPVNPSDITF